MTATMQAWRLHSYGGPETLHLDTVPIPTPGPTQVLVKVSHTAVNPFDWKIREGYLKDMMPLPLPYTIGIDFIGTVAALGSQTTTRFQPGSRVMNFNPTLGAFAEYILVEESILAHIPTTMSSTLAATLPMPATTAWQALHKAGPPQPGSSVLIHGASGVCGAWAVQFAKAAGMKVYGTASGKNKDYVLSTLGADVFIDYTSEDFTKTLPAASIDLILDFVLVGGTNDTTARSWSVLKKGGAMVSVADPSIMAPTTVPEGYRGFFIETRPDAEVLGNVAKQLAEGKFVSKIARVFGRGELVEALELNKAGGGTGRLVVDFEKE